MKASSTRSANESWESLLVAHAAVIKKLAGTGIWDEVSMREYDVLYTLAKSSAPIRLSELNRHLLLSQPALSRMVDRLVDRGLVIRTSSPDDRRSVALSLTDEGREQQRRVGRRHATDVARTMTAALDDQQLHQLGELCRALSETTENEEHTREHHS